MFRCIDFLKELFDTFLECVDINVQVGESEIDQETWNYKQEPYSLRNNNVER